jgi:Na+/H+-dicarboxylate symporter
MNWQSILAKLKKIVLNNILLILTIFSVFVGIGLGFILRCANLSPSDKILFGFPGELFLRMLKLIIFPLIGTSLISGISALGTSGKTGRIMARALAYYLTTTLSAIAVALVLVSTIKPGSRVSASNLFLQSNDTLPTTATTNRYDKLFTIEAIFDLFRNLFPDNIVKISFSIHQTQLTPHNQSLNASSYLEISQITRDGLNVLGLVMTCVVFTIFLNQMEDEGRLVRDFIEILYKLSITIIRAVMWLSPIGICFLVCEIILTIDNLSETFSSIPFYILTVVIGLSIQSLIVKPTLFLIVTRSNVLKYAKNMVESLLFAFATSSRYYNHFIALF